MGVASVFAEQGEGGRRINIRFEMTAVKNPEIRKAVDTLYALSANEMVRAEYEARKKAERDYLNGMEGAYQQGEQKGLQKGRKEEKFDIAKALLMTGDSVDKIIQVTGLSREEVEKLMLQAVD